MKTLNINSYVRIKPTEFGLETLRKKYEVIKEWYPAEFNRLTTPDEDGYIEMQLWQVMHIFGKNMYSGSNKIPFDTIIF